MALVCMHLYSCMFYGWYFFLLTASVFPLFLPHFSLPKRGTSTFCILVHIKWVVIWMTVYTERDITPFDYVRISCQHNQLWYELMMHIKSKGEKKKWVVLCTTRNLLERNQFISIIYCIFVFILCSIIGASRDMRDTRIGRESFESITFYLGHIRYDDDTAIIIISRPICLLLWQFISWSV